MSSRALCALAVGVLFLLGAEGDWPMVGKDSEHTGYSREGPAPPLRRAWKYAAAHSETNNTNWPVVYEGDVFASPGRGISAADAESGREIWRVEGRSALAVTVDESAVYSRLRTGFVALDRKTGRETWYLDFPEDDLDTIPIVSDGRLYVGSNDIEVFLSVDAATGRILWKQDLGYDPDGVPALSDGVLVVWTVEAAERSVFLIALNAENGQELWRQRIPSIDSSSPSILDGKVVYGDGEFNAVARDLKTGAQVWKTAIPGKFFYKNSPAVAFGDVFLVDRLGVFYRLDGDTGKIKWKTERVAKDLFHLSFPVIAGETIYITGLGGTIAGVSVHDGNLQYLHQLPGTGRASSGATDGKRFFFGKEGDGAGLYAFEHDPNGELYRPPSPLRGLIGAALVLLIPFTAFLLIRRQRAKR